MLKEKKIKTSQNYFYLTFANLCVACCLFSGVVMADQAEDEQKIKKSQLSKIIAPSVAMQVIKDPDLLQSETLTTEQKVDYQIFLRRVHDFEQTIDKMVGRVFEMRKGHIDDTIQTQIDAEEELATKARRNAIEYFEKFIEKYPSHKAHTPDAMYRLAELYYDDSYIQYLDRLSDYQDAQDKDQAVDLDVPQKEFDRTIAIFQKLVKKYPEYRNIDGAYYLLGYCLNDTGEVDEARMTWLNLVCSNKYTYIPGKTGKKIDPSPFEDRPAANLETDEQIVTAPVFVDPFTNCKPVTKNSRFFFESWWLIGNYHFDFDVSKFGVEKSISAYKRLVKDPSHKFYDRGLYKLAWSYFKADQYPLAISTFSEVVEFSDQNKERRGSGMRPEAMQYLAVCFFTEDWDMDLMPDVTTGIERLQDATLMPQDRKWTREVYSKLGEIYFDNEKNNEAIAVWELFLQKWPMDVQAPFVQEKIAITYNKMRKFDVEITERGKLTEYAPGSEWWNQNKDNPQEQNEVADMVRDAMLEAAYFHHRSGQKLRQRGLASQDSEILERAVEEYNLAAGAYRKFIDQNPDTPDAYDITFNLAETLFWSGQYEKAKMEYTNVRDSNLDSRFRDDSAYMVILALEEIIKLKLEDGSFVPRKEPPEPEGEPLVVKQFPIDPLMLELMKERDEFINAAPDHEKAATFKYQTAQTYFRYGNWDEAKLRYEKLYDKYCTSDPVGIISWKTLLNMATTMDDLDEKERLALAQKDRKCSFAGRGPDGEGAQTGDEIPLDELLGDVAMQRALDQFKECLKSEKAEVCTSSGTDLVAAVNQAPKHPSADAALHNAALAFETAQRFETAMDLYGRIVEEYPKSQWVDKCLFRQASAANSFFEYEKALDNYQILADEKRFKDSDYRVDAINNSAYILTNLQSYTKAVPYWERLAKEADDPAKAIESRFIASDMYFRAKRWRSAVTAYEGFIKRYKNDNDAGIYVVKASYRIGLANIKMGRRRALEDNWEQTVVLYKKLVDEPGSISAEYAAQSHFKLIELDMKKFENFKIQGKQKTLEKKIKEGAERVKSLEEKYREIQKYRRPEWSLAAEFRIGFVFEVYAKALLNIPLPPLDRETQKLLKQLPPEDRELVMIDYEDKFRMAMEEYVVGAEEKAQAEYKMSIDLARRGNISNDWTILALERMNAYDPENYPRQHNGIVDIADDTVSSPPWESEVQQ